MAARRLRAAFYRGGTSKAVVFNGADLPAEKEQRDAIFLHVLGSPDPYGRQLNGMGGGLSSLSKVVVVAPSDHPEADVDYTFVQIAVRDPVADYRSTCGNMSSAVGPFALDEGFVTAADGEALVRIHNTNTGQIYHARFAVRNGVAVEEGAFEIPGVGGSGAKVTLDFLEPGGAVTGALLPTGAAVDRIATEAGEQFDVSLVDAANPVVFVRAEDVGCRGTEAPEMLDQDVELMTRMEQIRCAGAVAMGMVPNGEPVAMSNPKVAMVAAARAFTALDGQSHAPGSHDIAVRLISMGNFHKAVTLSGGLCVAIAAQVPGTLLHALAPDRPLLRVGNPSGVLPVRAQVEAAESGPHAKSATTFRTFRRLMEGAVLYPDSLLKPDA